MFFHQDSQKNLLYLKHCCKNEVSVIMRRKFFSLNLDFLGFSASMLCALHCAALPLLLTAGAFSGFAWLENEIVEWFFIGSAIIFASWSLVTSFWQTHRNPIPLLLVVLGFFLIIWNHFGGGHGHTHTHAHFEWGTALLSVAGGIAIAIAHYLNWRLISRYRSCPVSH
jgi:hypothetical protein